MPLPKWTQSLDGVRAAHLPFPFPDPLMPATPDTSPQAVARVLRDPAAKLRAMGRMFSGSNFTDRYGDGPAMLAHAETLDALADALAQSPAASEQALFSALTPEQWDDRLVKAIKAERGQRNKIDGVAAALKAAFPELAPND